MQNSAQAVYAQLYMNTLLMFWFIIIADRISIWFRFNTALHISFIRVTQLCL